MLQVGRICAGIFESVGYRKFALRRELHALGCGIDYDAFVVKLLAGYAFEALHFLTLRGEVECLLRCGGADAAYREGKQ